MKSGLRNDWLCSVKLLLNNELEKPAIAGFFYALKPLNPTRYGYCHHAVEKEQQQSGTRAGAEK